MKMLSATSVSPDRYRPAIARSGARRKPGVCFTCVDGPAPPATKNANRRRTLVRRRLREGAARASVLDLDRDEAAAAASALDEQQHLIAAAALRGGGGIQHILQRRDLPASPRHDPP